MKKTMLLILFAGLFSLLTGCEKSAQEKVAEAQLKAIEQQKVIDEKRKNIMGDGKMPIRKLGEHAGGL